MRAKRIGVWMLVMAVVLLGYGVCANAASGKIAAKVNGNTIKSETVDIAMNNFMENQKMMGASFKEEDKEKLKKGILDELIAAELLYQESKKAGLGDLGKEVDEQFKNIEDSFASKDDFNKLLKERGISVKDLKEDIKKGVYIKAFLEKDVYSDITVKEEDKKSEYEKNKDNLKVPDQVRASHILIRVSEDTTPERKEEARKKIEGLRERALAGEDFSELAKANSEDNSASRGGDLGYFRKGDMVEPFEKAAFSLKPGEISDVVETQFGYHIIKSTDKKDAHMLTYEEVSQDVERFLLNKYRTEKLNKLVEDIKGKAKIEIY